jgi:hypothetical protein
MKYTKKIEGQTLELSLLKRILVVTQTPSGDDESFTTEENEALVHLELTFNGSLVGIYAVSPNDQTHFQRIGPKDEYQDDSAKSRRELYQFIEFYKLKKAAEYTQCPTNEDLLAMFVRLTYKHCKGRVYP